jgi:hypothetical protein
MFAWFKLPSSDILYKMAKPQGCTLAACKFENSCNMPGCGKLHSASTLFSTSKKLAGLVKPMRDLNLEAWENERKTVWI